MSSTAKQLIESIVEARVVPDKLVGDASMYAGSHSGFIEGSFIFRFYNEQNAVDFMNDIEPDCELGAECVSMKVHKGDYFVYVDSAAYNPPKDEVEVDAAEPVAVDPTTTDTIW